MIAVQPGNALTAAAETNEPGLDLSGFQVQIATNPYPHARFDNWLPESKFRALTDSFPSDADFSHCSQIMGGRNNLIRGNPDFDAFMAKTPAWSELLAALNSEGFVRNLLNQFGPHLRSHGYVSSVDAPFSNYTEPAGDAMLGSASVSSQPATSVVTPTPGSVYLTFDIARATTGYERGPHLDSRYKAIAFLLFFNDCQSIQAEGGIFSTHRLVPGIPTGKRFVDYGDCAESWNVDPKPNRAVFFLNCPSSYHSVSKIVASSGYRKFLYASIATYGVDNAWTGSREH